jgi:hypothetical protein
MYKIVYKKSEGRLTSRFLNAGLRSSPSRIQENSPESFSKATFVSSPRDAGRSLGMGCTGRRVTRRRLYVEGYASLVYRIREASGPRNVARSRAQEIVRQIMGVYPDQ